MQVFEEPADYEYFEELMFENIADITKRNKQILKVIDKGYSQHRIAKVLGISQQAVYGVIKRSGG